MPGDRIGNLFREVSTFIAPLMDESSGLKGNKTYSVGHDFTCVLSSVDYNHSRDGCSIEIVVSTTNSFAWIEELYVEICRNIEADSITFL